MVLLTCHSRQCFLWQSSVNKSPQWITPRLTWLWEDTKWSRTPFSRRRGEGGRHCMWLWDEFSLPQKNLSMTLEMSRKFKGAPWKSHLFSFLKRRPKPPLLWNAPSLPLALIGPSSTRFYHFLFPALKHKFKYTNSTYKTNKQFLPTWCPISHLLGQAHLGPQHSRSCEYL